MAINVLLGLVLALLAADVALSAAVVCRLARKGREPRAEEADQAALDQAAADLRRSREIDAGIDALMTYSVGSGRGTGGDGLL